MNTITTSPISIDESGKKGIVLNRMYTGSYLSTNLGHEVINMFQADDENHYLYLNSKGNFSSRGKNMDTMLLVRGRGEKRVEVVAMAKNIKPVDSACCQLPRDLGRINKPIHNAQMAFIHNIKYDGKQIKEIFGDEGKQSVFVSYVTDNRSFYKPAKRIIINFGLKDGTDVKKKHGTYYLKGEEINVNLSINFASTSLHQFIEYDSAPQDLLKLEELCKDESLWVLNNEKVTIKGYEKRQESLFDICKIQDDENKFSNALSYFIEKYPDIWKTLFITKLGVKLSNIDSVYREKDAKVEDEEFNFPTGGRIDLLILTPECYIVIENKIDSGIIIEGGISQIQRYYNYVMWLKKEAIKNLSDELKQINDYRIKRAEQYTKLYYKEGKRGKDWEKELVALETQIVELGQELKLHENREFRGVILCPDYNVPEPKELNVGDYTYALLKYSDLYIWLKENASDKLSNDSNFKAFHNAMKKHKCITKSEALYEEMKTRFYSQILKINKK